MPPAPHAERRLAAAAFAAVAFLALGAAAFIGGIVADSRAPSGLFDLVQWGPGAPPEYRDSGPTLLVCTGDAENFTAHNEGVNYNQRIENERTYEDCLAGGHRDLASAIAAAEPGARILILPGRYATDEPILIDGGADLQIEGLGDTPEDVLLTARFAADTVLEARDASMLYLKGFTVGQARENGLLLSGVEGAAVESVAAVQSGAYGLRVADSPTVSLTGCRAEAADTAGIAIEDSTATVDACEATGNLVGIHASGDHDITLTANRVHGNTTGIVVTGAFEKGPLSAEANRLYDNNTDHYANLGTAACTDGPAARAWDEAILCPGLTVPSGVGILVAGGVNGTYEANRIWNQQTAAIAIWGTPGLQDGLGSDGNRFADDTFGLRDDGQRQRNRLDLWWDGIGADNCFEEPNLGRTSPAVLPGCGVVDQTSRVYGDPLRALKHWQCGIGDASAGVPEGCDWFGARFTDRIEFRAAVVFAASLLFLTGAGWLAAARAAEPPRAGRMTFSAMATGAGGLLLVLAVWSGRADYEALAIGLWGLGWLLAGRSWFHCGMRVLGSFTGLIGALAVLDAVDRAVWTIAPLPLSPAWFWLALLPLWTLLALSLAFGPRRGEEDPPPVERTPVTAPSHDRFDW
ncbi:right-handed parallel beta-helix repeat-containing protein [Glycomyces rhizosphaerae]|uniref:Right-handed parallel beta-helix repeat-containing protein n=1 Tax=Glycomyces rhizosphaerae TaxID=2054422 RepID=A0ABV7Q106_9ACTN